MELSPEITEGLQNATAIEKPAKYYKKGDRVQVRVAPGKLKPGCCSIGTIESICSNYHKKVDEKYYKKNCVYVYDDEGNDIRILSDDGNRWDLPRLEDLVFISRPAPVYSHLEKEGIVKDSMGVEVKYLDDVVLLFKKNCDGRKYLCRGVVHKIHPKGQSITAFGIDNNGVILYPPLGVFTSFIKYTHDDTNNFMKYKDIHQKYLEYMGQLSQEKNEKKS